MENEIVVKQNNSPSTMILEAVKSGTDLDKVEKLLELQMRWEANEARKIFAYSFATVQEKIDAVVKTKVNSQTHSKYADLGDIIESTKPIYTKEGFSIIFYEGITNIVDNIRICADVLHKSGHKETYFYDIPFDGVGIKGNANMTKIHGKASSTSYGRRYLMCMIWNIPTADSDGQQDIKFIDEKQKSQLIDLATAKNIVGPKMIKFLAYLKITSFDELLVKDFSTAIKALNAVKEEVKK